MIFYRCKCGDSQAWGSMPPAQCAWCEKCQSSLAAGPDGHRDRVPHEFVASKVETDGGDATLTRCWFCHRTRKEIEADEKTPVVP